MEYPSYQEYLRKQRETYAKQGKSFDAEMRKISEENREYMKKHLPSIQSEEDLYFYNMD